MNEQRSTTLLMLTSLLALALFLTFWLRSVYQDAHLVMTEKGNLLYQEAVREVQDSVYQRFIIRFVEKASNNEYQYTDDLFELPNLSPDDEDLASDEVTIKVAIDDSRNQRLRFFQRDSTMDSTQVKRRQRFPELGLKSRLDSIDGDDTLVYIERLSSARRFGLRKEDDGLQKIIRQRFTTAIAMAGLPLEFRIEEQPEKQDSTDLDFFPGNFNTYLQEQVIFTQPGWHLSQKIAGPFFISVFLFLLTALAFWSLRRSSARALQYTQLKSDFMSNMTHELKTPITTVGLAVEAMRGFVQSGEQEKIGEYLTISQHELNRLSLLVDKVLKLSLFENDVPRLKKETVDLREIFCKVKDAMTIQLDQAGGVLNWRSEGEDFLLPGDPVHLSNVLFNLLDNTLKYTQQPPIVEVELVAAADHLLLTISDNGIGIPLAYQQKVFDRFFRVPQQGSQHNVKGYGLGLSYVADIVRQHQGEITLDSKPGEGTTFKIKLPR